MLEAAVVLGKGLEILYRHTPANRSAGYLPEGRLWDELVKHHQSGRLLGVAHSHPGNGPPMPSGTDLDTFETVESVYGLGVRLQWWILSLGDRTLSHIAWDPNMKLYRTRSFADMDSAQEVAISHVRPPPMSLLMRADYGGRHWGAVLEDLSLSEDLPLPVKDMLHGFVARGEQAGEMRGLCEVLWHATSPEVLSMDVPGRPGWPVARPSVGVASLAWARGAPLVPSGMHLRYSVLARVAFRHPGLGIAMAAHAVDHGRNAFASYLLYGLGLVPSDLPGSWKALGRG